MKDKNVSLSDEIRAVIFGSLLGDGSLKIHKNYKNARFSFRHSANQKEYFFWKVSKLKEISSTKSVFVQKSDGFSTQKKLRYQSQALESLTDLYHAVHRKNKLKISRKWLNQMTELSLAIWWLDDGSIIANGRKGVFCTDGFDEKSVKLLTRYLNKVWGINVHPAAISRSRENGYKKEEYWRLWIRSTEELKKFLRLILPHIKVPETLPKVILMYNDSKLQQRWISEVVSKTGFSQEDVEKYLLAKKNKWKRFQKMI